jgi:hypothetical protein
VREAVLTLAHCESAAYVRCPEGKPAGSQTALIKAGTLLNIWLYFHHGTRVIAVLGVETLCAGFTAGPED